MSDVTTASSTSITHIERQGAGGGGEFIDQLTN